MSKWRYREGTIVGVRGRDRTWTVRFVVKKTKNFLWRKIMVFRRHELKKVSS